MYTGEYTTMYIIEYQTKVTNSNNTYYQIEKQDKDWLIAKLIQISAYMNELALSKDPDYKLFVKWYTTPDKLLPYSSQFRRSNSPQSFVAGTINNLLYGSQSDIAESQAKHLSFIINSFTDLSSEAGIELQKNSDKQPVLFQHNVWEISK
jgi:hypothetical protein